MRSYSVQIQSLSETWEVEEDPHSEVVKCFSYENLMEQYVTYWVYDIYIAYTVVLEIFVTEKFS